jgi:hypothetical protein
MVGAVPSTSVTAQAVLRALSAQQRFAATPTLHLHPRTAVDALLEVEPVEARLARGAIHAAAQGEQSGWGHLRYRSGGQDFGGGTPFPPPPLLFQPDSHHSLQLSMHESVSQRQQWRRRQCCVGGRGETTGGLVQRGTQCHRPVLLVAMDSGVVHCPVHGTNALPRLGTQSPAHNTQIAPLSHRMCP